MYYNMLMIILMKISTFPLFPIQKFPILNWYLVQFSQSLMLWELNKHWKKLILFLSMKLIYLLKYIFMQYFFRPSK